jgi:hypothetical protein
MDTTKFDVMLDTTDENFIDDLSKALGLADGEKATFIFPQFTRTDGRVITYFPRALQEFEILKMLKPENLKKIGCLIWDEDRFKTHWLYPYEWFSNIPEGLDVVDIFGETDKFNRENADNDIRYGALSFGFIQNKVN